jgi:hypothetical protein
MTDEKLIEILATKGMGYERSDLEGMWITSMGGALFIDIFPEDFQPLTDLNAIAEVEARLTEEQWEAYIDELRVSLNKDVDNCTFFGGFEREVRHAPARTCAEALAKVLGGKRYPA